MANEPTILKLGGLKPVTYKKSNQPRNVVDLNDVGGLTIKGLNKLKREQKQLVATTKSIGPEREGHSVPVNDEDDMGTVGGDQEGLQHIVSSDKPPGEVSSDESPDEAQSDSE